MPIYLFVILFILSIIYFIFGWKHDLYDKYKHESCFYKNWTIFNLCQKKKKITLY